MNSSEPVKPNITRPVQITRNYQPCPYGNANNSRPPNKDEGCFKSHLVLLRPNCSLKHATHFFLQYY